jgi:hypothetical protein
LLRPEQFPQVDFNFCRAGQSTDRAGQLSLCHLHHESHFCRDGIISDSAAKCSEQSGIIVIGDAFTVEEVRSCRSRDR